MGRIRQSLIAGFRVAPALVGALALAAAAWGQAPPQPPTTRSTTAVDALPTELPALLADVRDYSFDFDHPAFYALVEFVKGKPVAPTDADPLRIDDWRVLAERPADFRGRAITVEGIVGVNRSYQLPRHPQLGTLWQLELHRRDQPIACTVVLTGAATDIGRNASARFTGFFLMMRQYDAASGQVRRAALLVAAGPDAIWHDQPRAEGGGVNLLWLAAAAAGALVATWLILRRCTRPAGHPDLRTLRARHAAPMDLSADVAAWSHEGEPPGGRRPS